MPRIQEYTPQVQAPGPVNVQATAADFGGAAAQGLTALGNDTQEAGQFLEKRAAASDIAEQHAKVSQVRNQAVVDLHEALRTADPSDKGFVPNFMDGVNQKLQDLQDGAATPAGRNFLTRSSQAVSGEVLRTAAAGRQELAGQAAIEQHGTALNANTNTVRLDPTQLDSVQAQNDAAIDAQVRDGNMDTKLALRLKSEDSKSLAVSALQGLMDKNPQSARDLLDSGKFDSVLHSQDTERMYRAADARDKQNEEQADIDDRRAKRILQGQQEDTMKDFNEKIDNGTLNLMDIQNSNLSAEQGRLYRGILNSSSKKALAYTDPQVFSSFFDRIHGINTDGKGVPDTTELAQAVHDHQLSITGPMSMRALQAEIADKKTPEAQALAVQKNAFNSQMKSALGWDSQNHIYKDPQGPANYAKLITLENQEEAAARKGSKPIVDLYTDNSETYLGPKALAMGRTLPQIMQGMTGQVGGAAPKPNSAAATDMSMGSKLSDADIEAIRNPKQASGDQRFTAAADYARLNKALSPDRPSRVDQIFKLWAQADSTGRANFTDELKQMGYKGALPGSQTQAPPPAEPSSDAKKIRKANESAEQYLERMKGNN